MGKPITRRWTKQRVVKEIKNLKTLSPRAVQKSVPSLYGAAVRIFGSWRAAVGATGQQYDTGSRKLPGSWNKDLVIQKIASLPHKHSSFVRKDGFLVICEACVLLKKFRRHKNDGLFVFTVE